MKTSSLSKRSQGVRLLLIIPILCLMIWGFSSKQEVIIPIQNDERTAQSINERIKVYVNQKTVTVNGKQIKTKDFAATLDAITASWSTTQLNEAQWHLSFKQPDEKTIKTLEAQYLKSNMYKITKRPFKATPPPAPDAKNAPTPPPAPDAAVPPKPDAPNYYSVPEPPPPPNPDPVEYIKELAKRGAIFYSGPHKNSLEQMLELARKSDTLQLDVSDYPIVRLDGC